MDISPGPIGELLGISIGLILAGMVLGTIFWIPIRILIGKENTPKLLYFFIAGTIVFGVFILIGNIGCMLEPAICNI